MVLGTAAPPFATGAAGVDDDADAAAGTASPLTIVCASLFGKDLDASTM